MLPDGEQDVQNTDEPSADVQPETQAETAAVATAAVIEPVHTVSIPLPPVEDVKNKKGKIDNYQQM